MGWIVLLRRRRRSGKPAADAGDAARRPGRGAPLGWRADPRRRASPAGKAIAALAVLGFGNNALPFALITWSQTRLPGGLASILVAATPLFTVLAAHLLTAEEKLADPNCLERSPEWRASPGSSARTCCGAAPQTMRGRNCRSGRRRLVCLVGHLRSAHAFLRLTPIDVVAGQATAATVSRALGARDHRPWTIAMPGEAAIASVLGIAALSTALAFVVYFRILAGAGATNVLLVTLLTPATAVVSAWSSCTSGWRRSSSSASR